MRMKNLMATAVTMLALLTQAQAQTLGMASTVTAPPGPKAEAPAKPVQATCRNVPLQRSDAKVTREEVIAELQRARREGELDWYISSNPPAVQRRPCITAENGPGG